MDFVFTLLYVAFSLVSPGVLPDAIVSLHVNIILGVLAILACIPNIAKSRFASVTDSYLLLGLLFVSAISLMLTGWLGGVFPALEEFVPIAFVFPFVVISCRTLGRIKVLVGILLLVAMFIFLQGYVALAAGDYTSPYILTENVVGGSLYRFRGLGVLADPNDLGQFFVVLIPLTWLWWRKGKTFRNIVLTLVPAVTLCVALFHTHSRGGTLALIAVIWFSFRKRLGLIGSSILTAGALLGAVAMNVAGNRGLNQDDGDRLGLWATGLSVFRSHPLFGVGLNNFHNFSDTGQTAHNSYVLCLSELGIFGYFCWLGMIVYSWNGLSVIVHTSRELLDITVDYALDRLRISSPFQQQLEVAGFPIGLGSAGQQEGLAASSPHKAGRLTSVWPPSPDTLEHEGSTHKDRQEAVRIGHVLQASVLGLLTSSFFISRTFSMVMYLVLALVTAFRIMESRAHPYAKVGALANFRNIVLIVLGSIVFIYLFVRLHGVIA